MPAAPHPCSARVGWIAHAEQGNSVGHRALPASTGCSRQSGGGIGNLHVVVSGKSDIHGRPDRLFRA